MGIPLRAWGIATELPQGWEGQISRRATPSAARAQLALDDRMPVAAGPVLGTPPAPGTAPVASDGDAEEVMNPVMHLGNFALPPDRGDFGSGAVDVMTAQHALIVLLEYGPECVGTALFRPRGLPEALRPADFSPNALQRQLPRQAGHQRFFTEAGRAFCLFVVLGAQANAPTLCAKTNAVLRATTIGAR